MTIPGILFQIFLAGIAYIFMEGVAAWSHKYLMHGVLSEWHKSHHINDLKRPEEQVRYNGLEKNDRFFLLFAVPAIILMICGISFQQISLISLSVGITLYGFTYFMIHDIMYHKRISVPFLQRNHSRYFRAVMRAHGAHHKPKNKSDFESYGLLIFPKKYLKDPS